MSCFKSGVLDDSNLGIHLGRSIALMFHGTLKNAILLCKVGSLAHNPYNKLLVTIILDVVDIH